MRGVNIDSFLGTIYDEEITELVKYAYELQKIFKKYKIGFDTRIINYLNIFIEIKL